MTTMAGIASDAIRGEAFNRLKNAEEHLGGAETFIRLNEWESVAAKLDHAAEQYKRAAQAFRAINQPSLEQAS